MQVLPPDETVFAGVSFSPDGNYIHFTRSDKSNSLFNFLYSMPVLGGSPHQVLRDIDSPVSFSPDGKQFAFMRGVPDRNVIEIRIANADGTGDHLLASIPSLVVFMFGVAWSPDGKTIAAPILQKGSDIRWALDVINIANGGVRELFSGPEGIGRPAWLPDGSAVLMNIQLLDEHRCQLWLVSFPSGAENCCSQPSTSAGMRTSSLCPAGKRRRPSKSRTGKRPTSTLFKGLQENSLCAVI